MQAVGEHAARPDHVAQRGGTKDATKGATTDKTGAGTKAGTKEGKKDGTTDGKKDGTTDGPEEECESGKQLELAGEVWNPLAIAAVIHKSATSILLHLL